MPDYLCNNVNTKCPFVICEHTTAQHEILSTPNPIPFIK